MNSRKDDLLLYWGVLEDGPPTNVAQAMEKDPVFRGVITGTQQALYTRQPPQGWPPPPEDPCACDEVMAWLCEVVRWRRASGRRPWTPEEEAFLDQMVECIMPQWRASITRPIEVLHKTLVQQIHLRMLRLIPPVWQRLSRDVEGFDALKRRNCRLTEHGIAAVLAHVLVHGVYPARKTRPRTSLPERFALESWGREGWLVSIDNKLATLLHGPVHADQDSPFRRLMSGAITRGLVAFHLRHTFNLPLQTVKFLAVDCLTIGRRDLLFLLLHQTPEKIDETDGVLCAVCKTTYRWKTLDPLTWGCDCGDLQVYCPACTSPLAMTTAGSHRFVEERRLMLRTASPTMLAYGSIGRILRRCPTDTQIQQHIVEPFMEEAKQRSTTEPVLRLLKAMRDHKSGVGSIVPYLAENLNALSSYRTKKGRRAHHTHAQYEERLAEFLSGTGISLSDGRLAMDHLLERYVEARGAETPEVHYVPDIATACPVPECFVTDTLSQRLSKLAAQFVVVQERQAPPQRVLPAPARAAQAVRVASPGVSDDDRELWDDTLLFFQQLPDDLPQWVQSAANLLLEKPVGDALQTWTYADCKALLAKLRAVYSAGMDTHLQRGAWGELGSLHAQLEEQGVDCQDLNTEAFILTLWECVGTYLQQVDKG